VLGSKLPKLTGHTHVSPSALRRDLSAVRELRYAVEREEALLGEAGVAAPIFDRRPGAIGAVGVAGPKERLLKRTRLPDIAALVVETARGISRELGAPRWPAR
jgi:DNA-binding IclR family transcriptional regulator